MYRFVLDLWYHGSMSEPKTPPWKPFLIGISGPKEHGKTTLAHALKHALPPAMNRSHDPIWMPAACWEFADPMVEMARILTLDNEFAKEKVYEIIPGKPLTGTQVLQLLGTDAIRGTFGIDTWTHYFKKLVEGGKLRQYAWVMVPGTRLPIEQEMMNFSIWIEAPGVVSNQHVNHVTEAHHEVLKKNADLIVTRDGSRYTPSIDEITNRIVCARQVWEGPR